MKSVRANLEELDEARNNDVRSKLVRSPLRSVIESQRSCKLLPPRKLLRDVSNQTNILLASTPKIAMKRTYLGRYQAHESVAD